MKLSWRSELLKPSTPTTLSTAFLVASAPVPADVMCTEQYGGPQRARVTGTWHGRAVRASFTRTDGCQIARWDAIVPVLPDLH